MTSFVATWILLSRQKNKKQKQQKNVFVATKIILVAAPANDGCLALCSVSLSISWLDGDLPREYSIVDSCKIEGWNYNRKDCPSILTSGEVTQPDDTTKQYTINVLATDYQWVSTGQCRQSLCVLSACGILSFCHISLCIYMFKHIVVCSVYIFSLSLSGTSTLRHLYWWSASTYTIRFCRMLYARGWHNTLYNRKKRCANSKDATALSWSYFSVVQR